MVLKMLPRPQSPRPQFFTLRIDPKPVNNLFIFSTEKNSRCALRTNQIVEFDTVPAWKKINISYLLAGRSV